MSNEVSLPNSLHEQIQPRYLVSRRFVQMLFMVVFAVLTLTQTGCRINRLAFTDAWMLSYRDHVWSKRAYNLSFANTDRPYAEDFEAGFRAGYQDVACGGDGYVPAMPPNSYRAAEYQSSEGAQCVNAWFEGYPEGVKAARSQDVGTYHNVLISRMINAAVKQADTEQKLPADVPIVSPNLTKASYPTSNPVATAPPVPSTQPAARQTPLPFPRSRPNIPPPLRMPTEPTATPAVPATSPQNTTAPVNVEASAEQINSDAQVSFPQTLPPIVTGSGVIQETEIVPSPSVVQPASYESNRRNR